MNSLNKISRRSFIHTLGAGIFVAATHTAFPLPLWARSERWGLEGLPPARDRYDLTIGYSPLFIDGREGTATGINGTVPGPLVRLREGDDVTLNVTNALMDTEHSSIHWHGILVPFPMDGVPGVNFAGIAPGETYHYRYRVAQAGTYWYHSHSFLQEQSGTYICRMSAENSIELLLRIVQCGSAVEVLEPQDYREYVISYLGEILSKYTD